ncbi:serine hydrolase domain-containing protein [Streptomyces noursei]|uniref:serine hydrolase domain-containing protein n=1 Tax=Streptomyces noursei TaxID=1971 RepID=UPI003558EE77
MARLLIERVTGRSYADEVRRRILVPLGMRDTVVPGTSPELPGPHAHAYYRYQEAGKGKTVDITRQNPSWVSSAGEIISTTKDLQTFVSALMRGKLLPAPLLAQMRKPHPTPDPKSGYGLGLFVQDVGPNCGGTLFTHDGHVQGYATLMYSTPDGSRTLEASFTYAEDAAQSQAAAYQKAVRTLTTSEFCHK